MKFVVLDLHKYGLEYLETKEDSEVTNDDIRKLTEAFSAEIISPRIPGIAFVPENIEKLLSFSKCRRCGKCCRPHSQITDHPGIIVADSELTIISKHTKYSLKALRKRAKVNTNADYEVGARYLPLPCTFYNQNERSCTIYSYRPSICRIYPVSNSPEGDVTVDLQCDFGREIYQNTMRQLRDAAIERRQQQ